MAAAQTSAVVNYPRGTLLRAGRLLDAGHAHAEPGTLGVVFEEANAYGDGNGPMVRWLTGGACNVYRDDVEVVDRRPASGACATVAEVCARLSTAPSHLFERLDELVALEAGLAACVVPVSAFQPGDDVHTGDDELLDLVSAARVSLDEALEEMAPVDEDNDVHLAIRDAAADLGKACDLRVRQLRGEDGR